MFRPSDIIIEAFTKRLEQEYDLLFGDTEPQYRYTLTRVANTVLHLIARSDALYHDLDHTLLVTQVGFRILHGRIVRENNVGPLEWIHFVASLLCFAVGMVRGICPGDDAVSCVIDAKNNRIDLPKGATDGFLWPYFADRSKLYVLHYFRDHPILDARRMAEYIEYARFPPPSDRNFDTRTYPGLLRACHLIGAVADPNFMSKMPALMWELVESNMTQQLGYNSVAEWQKDYPNFFWFELYPLIADGVEYLSYTARGRIWLATMQAQVLKLEMD